MRRAGGVVVAVGAVVAVIAVVALTVGYRSSVYTWAPDRSPTGRTSIDCGSPVAEAFKSGPSLVPDPPVVIPVAACRDSAQTRASVAVVALVAGVAMAVFGTRRRLAHRSA